MGNIEIREQLQEQSQHQQFKRGLRLNRQDLSRSKRPNIFEERHQRARTPTLSGNIKSSIKQAAIQRNQKVSGFQSKNYPYNNERKYQCYSPIRLSKNSKSQTPIQRRFGVQKANVVPTVTTSQNSVTYRKQQGINNHTYSPVRNFSFLNDDRGADTNDLKQNFSRSNETQRALLNNTHSYLPFQNGNCSSADEQLAYSLRGMPQYCHNSHCDASSNLYQMSQLRTSRKGKIVPNSARKSLQATSIKQNSCNSYQCEQDDNIYNVQTRRSNCQEVYQNRDIIKKVRNFNDFLNEIKRKLKQEPYRSSLRRNQSIRNKMRKQNSKHQHNFSFQKVEGCRLTNKSQEQNIVESLFQRNPQIPGNNSIDTHQSQFQHLQVYDCSNTSNQHANSGNSRRKIEIELKLENEKLELEKYRKLVERELSKSHSIESISLSTKKSGEKILTIEYQNLKSIAFNQVSKRSFQLNNTHQQNNRHLQQLKDDTDTDGLFTKKKTFYQNLEETAEVNKLSLIHDNFKVSLSKLTKGKVQEAKIDRNEIQSTISDRKNTKKTIDKLSNKNTSKKFQLIESRKEVKKQQQKSKLKQVQQIQLYNSGKTNKQILRLKGEYEKTMKALLGVGLILNTMNESQQDQESQVSQAESSSENKIQRIEGLFEKLTQIQSNCIESEKRVKQLLKEQDSSSSINSSKSSHFSIHNKQ